MDAIECLKTRRSIRAYKDTPVPKEIVEDIVDCGRLAATARNVQPWEFIVVTDPDVRKTLADISEYGKFIAQSPVCIVVFCQDSKYYIEDGSAATQNILNAAHARGLGSCWVAGDKKPYARQIGEVLGAPEDQKLVAMIAVGYPAETSSRPKRSLQEVLHRERF